MKTISKKTLTVLILLAVVGGIIVIKWVSSLSAPSVDPVEARSKGPKGAKVQVIEFLDFECPACAYGAKVLKEYMAQYPHDLHVQIKYYPLMNIHPHAVETASYAECTARQGKFWPFFETLMEQQNQWSRLINAKDIFDQLAKNAGADMGRLKSCLASKDVSATIMEEKTVGRSKGVQSTPTYFVNGKMAVGGKSLVEELDKYFPKSQYSAK